MLGPPKEVYKAVMFGDNMKAFSILFQRPIVQIGVAVEEGATQLQAFFIFSLCQKGSTLIPEAHQLSKPVAASSMCCSQGSAEVSKRFCITGTNAGSRCLDSPALVPRLAQLAQGFPTSVNIEIFKFVSLFLHSCWLY